MCLTQGHTVRLATRSLESTCIQWTFPDSRLLGAVVLSVWSEDQQYQHDRGHLSNCIFLGPLLPAAEPEPLGSAFYQVLEVFLGFIWETAVNQEGIHAIFWFIHQREPVPQRHSLPASLTTVSQWFSPGTARHGCYSVVILRSHPSVVLRKQPFP